MRLSTLLAPAALASAPLAQVTVFDTEMDDWKSQIDQIIGNASGSSSASGAGGNPGAARLNLTVIDGVASVTQNMVMNGPDQAIDPLALCGVASVDLSMHVRLASAVTFDHIAAEFVLEQDGVIYYATGTYGHVQLGAGWTTFSASGLTAAHFTSASGTPDFSAEGSPIRFGLWTGHSSLGAPNTGSTTSYVDNYSVSAWPANQCVCENEASVTTLGGACGQYSPILFTTPPALGSAMTVTVAGAPGTVGHLRIARDTGYVLPLAPGCEVLVDLGQSWSLVDMILGPAGTAQAAVPIPSDTALCGLDFIAQGGVFPTASPLGFDLTNAVRLVTGS